MFNLSPIYNFRLPLVCMLITFYIFSSTPTIAGEMDSCGVIANIQSIERYNTAVERFYNLLNHQRRRDPDSVLPFIKNDNGKKLVIVLSVTGEEYAYYNARLEQIKTETRKIAKPQVNSWRELDPISKRRIHCILAACMIFSVGASINIAPPFIFGVQGIPFLGFTALFGHLLKYSLKKLSEVTVEVFQQEILVGAYFNDVALDNPQKVKELISEQTTAGHDTFSLILINSGVTAPENVLKDLENSGFSRRHFEPIEAMLQDWSKRSGVPIE